MSRPLHVFILCHRGDQIFTRICVASVRFWSPDISIYLLKDDGVRPFSTKEIEKRWRVSVLSAAGIKASRLMNKFRMFVCSLEGRALYIDSDIVFLGRVFDVLDTYTEDILISAEQIVLLCPRSLSNDQTQF